MTSRSKPIAAVGEQNLACGHVDAAHVAEDDIDVPVARDHAPDGLGDVGGGKGGGRDLIEERHEEMIVAPVDDRHLDRRPAETLGTGEAAEAGPDDDDMGLRRRGHGGPPLCSRLYADSWRRFYQRRAIASTAAMTTRTMMPTMMMRRADVASR